MNGILALGTGLVAGTHTATWGMYKDAPHEGFTWPRYFRSTVLSGASAVVLQRLTGLDPRHAPSLVMLFGLTYVVERALNEFYKTFYREQDQSKFFIPMQFAVFGRVVKNRVVRWSVGTGLLLLILLAAWGVRLLQRADTGIPPLALVLLVGSFGGWISAIGGAWKDAPHEGFELFKFFRSPLIALGYALLLSRFSSDLLSITAAALGYTVATIETYKTFFFPNKPRGKFAGKPILHPEMLRFRQRFLPVYVAIWLAILAGFVVALAQTGLGPGAAAAFVADLVGEGRPPAVGGIPLYATTFAVCFVSGLLPPVNSEIYLLGVAALAGGSDAFPTALAAAAGQMAAKAILYLAGTGALRLPLARYEAKLSAARSALERFRSRTGLFLFVSAFTGLPPIYVVSVLAGVLRLDFRLFMVVGSVGRLLRFWLILLFPQALRALLGGA